MEAYIALLTAIAAPHGTGNGYRSNCTELRHPDYARILAKSVSEKLPTGQVEVTLTNPNFPPLLGFELYDQPIGGNLLFYLRFERPLQAGMTFKIVLGAG